MLVIAVVSVFLLCMSAFMLTSCGDEEEVEHTHDYTNVQTIAATCGSTGLEVSQCECGQFKVEVIDITTTGHKFQDGYCTVCGMSETASDADVLAAIEAAEAANASAADIAAAVQTKLNEQLAAANNSSDIATLSGKVDEITTKIGDLSTTANSLKESMATLATAEEVAAVQTKVNAIEAELEELETALATAKTELATAQADLSTKIQTVIDSIHEHTWVKGTVIAPTCRAEGFTVYTCEGCGSVQTADYVAANGGEHQFDNYQVTKAATCGQTGIKVWYCTLCSATYSEIIPMTTEHEYAVDAENSTGLATDANGALIMNNGTPVIANCESGATIAWICTVCGDKKTDNVAVKAHDWEHATVTTPATCGTPGVKTCANCATTQSIPTEGAHTWVDVAVTKEPTCTEKGLKTIKCTVCNTEATQEIDALGHTPTYDETGAKVMETVYENIKISDNPTTIKWNNEDITVYPGTADQTQYDICSRCGELFGNYNKVSGVHTFVVDEEETGKDVEAGIIKAAAAGEESIYGYVSNSCTETGYVWFYCTDENCISVNGEGEIVTKNVTTKVPVRPRQHNLVDDTENSHPATCTVDGVAAQKCSYDCGYTESTPIPAAHTWGDPVTVAATCEVDGSITRTCAVCNATDTTLIPATGHTWDDGVVTTAQTCVDNGVKTYTCTVCGKTRTEEIPADGVHDFSVNEGDTNPYGFELSTYYNRETKEYELCWTTAGCDRSGSVVYYCKVCDYYEIDYSTSVPMLGHLKATETVVNGDCITGGVYNVTICLRCGWSDTVMVSQPDGHTLTYEAGVDATCTEAGYSAFAYCTVCHLVIKADENMTAENLDDYKYSTNYVTDANGENCYYYGETTDATTDTTDATTDTTDTTDETTATVADETTDETDTTDDTTNEKEAANKATLEALAIPALGHKFDGEYSLTAENCTDSGWMIKVCSRCGYNEDGVLTLKADTEGYEADETLYATLSVEEGVELTDDEKTALVDAINTQLGLTGDEALTYADLETLTTGYNFTAIKYVKATGHSFANTVTCVALEDVTDVDSYIAYAQKLNENLTTEALTAIWEAAQWTEGLENKVASVCSKCGEILVATDHDIQYYAYRLTLNGEDLDWSVVKAALEDNYTVANGYDADGVKAALADTDWANVGKGSWVTVNYTQTTDLTEYVFTMEELDILGFVTNEGRANCYFKAFCANECGEAMGNDHAHVRCEDETIVGKYPSCQNATYCVWCDVKMGPAGDHVLAEITKELEAEYADELAALLKNTKWYKEDVAATCAKEGIDYTYEICLPCLLAWYADNTKVTWTENENYTVTSETLEKTDHSYAQLIVGLKVVDAWLCSEGTKFIDVCVNCGDIRIDTAEDAAAPEAYATELTDAQWTTVTNALSKLKLTGVDDSVELASSDAKVESYTTDTNGWYNEVEPQNHIIALQDGYQNTAKTNEEGDLVYSFFCINCGYAIQTYVLDDTTLADNYHSVYATEEQVAAYNTVDEDGNSTAEFGIAHAVTELDNSSVTITVDSEDYEERNANLSTTHKVSVDLSESGIDATNGYVITITVSGVNTTSLYYNSYKDSVAKANLVDENQKELENVTLGAEAQWITIFFSAAEDGSLDDVVITVTVSAASSEEEEPSTEEPSTEEPSTEESGN